jgi:U3 small nucleolar RNA-associated protein 4
MFLYDENDGNGDERHGSQIKPLNSWVFEYRYHWTVPVFDGTPATAAVFHAGFSNVLIVSSPANQLYVLDVEMKVPGEWYKRYGMHIAKQLLEFPGGIVGLSLPLSPDSTSIIAYSSR